MTAGIGRLAGAAALLALAACDSIPLMELKNGAAQSVSVNSVTIVHAFAGSDPRVNAAVGPDGSVRFVGHAGPLRLAAGPCEYVYVIPAEGLVFYMNSVTQVELGGDLRLYLRSWRDSDAGYHSAEREPQPAGWPLEANSKACR